VVNEPQTLRRADAHLTRDDWVTFGDQLVRDQLLRRLTGDLIFDDLRNYFFRGLGGGDRPSLQEPLQNGPLGEAADLFGGL
jgi:hypothetical protein